MTQIVQAGTTNVLALGAPKAVVQIQTPTPPVTGVPVNILGYIGAASWGPVNIPMVVGGNDEQVATFGPVTNRKFDLSSAVAVAVENYVSSFKNVRVSDGTDTAATGTYSTSETFATETIAGTVKAGDIPTLTFTPTAGSPIVVSYTVPAGPPTASAVAASLAALLSANTQLQAAGFAFSVAGAVISVYCPGCTAPGTGWTSITPSVGGSSPTTTFTAGTSTAATVKLTLTALYTGTVGNGLLASLQPGTLAGSTALVLARPGFVAEKFDNLTGTGNLLWANIANAVNNGNSALRGPSQLCVASAGTGAAAAPNAATTVPMTGGTDGWSGITDATLLGVDVVPRKGLYALRAQGVGIACPVDASVSTYWTNFAAFGQSEGILVETSTPSADTLTNAATELATAGVDNYALRVTFGDWLYWYDTTNQTERVLAPATFMAAMRAQQAPQNSTLNKIINGIIGSQKTLTGGVWSDADKDALYSYRLDLICNNPPGGQYWAANNGINTSSNAAINGDNYAMMTDFIARSIGLWAGKNIGLLQTPDQRKAAKAVMDDFFNDMWQEGMIGNADSANGIGVPPWSVKIDDTTTPPNMAALGYEIAAVRVQYLAVIRWFVVNLMGGQTVQVNVSQTPPAFARS